MTALADAIAAQARAAEAMLRLDISPAIDRLADAGHVWLVGTGTSQHAAELGVWMFGSSPLGAGWRSSAVFARNGPSLGRGDGVVVISHTGETAFARAARARALEAGARVVSITAQGVGWDEGVETVAREKSETYTVSYTAALVVLARLAQALGAREIGADQLAALPERLAAAVGDPPDVAAPERLLVLAGAGPAAITAREGALKLREASWVAAEGYESEYLLHGSAVPLDHRDSLLLVQPGGDPDGLSGAIGRAAEAAGVAVGTVTEPPGLPPALEQIPLTARLQMLASRLADEAGHDPDAVIAGPWAGDDLWERGAPG